MKKWFIHILLLAGLFGMLTTSCSQEEGLEPQASDEKVQVMFTIALDGPSSARSRGTWGDNMDNNTENNYPEHIGDNFDNSIDPDMLFVKLTIGSQTYDVQNIAYWQEGNINEYKFVGEVDVTATSLTGAKVMVFANMTPAQTIGGETFNANYSTFPGTGVEYIPMWGVHTITAAEGLSLTPGSRTELRTPIYLLRAMAKVEVIMANDDYEISDIKLNGYNNTGICLPTGWNGENTTTTTGLDLDGVFRPQQSFVKEALKTCFTESTTANGFQCFEIYVPEYLNFDSNNQATVTPSTITVTVDGKNYNIEFKNYSNGSAIGNAYNIVRNHIYRFNITAVKTGMEFTLSVAPWADKVVNHEYGKNLSYSTGSWSNYSARDGNTIEMRAGSSATDNTTTAVYAFTVNTPKTIEWMAVLEDPAGKFQFDMSQTSGEGTVEEENAIQRTVKGELLVTGSNLKLGVKAITPNEKGQYEAILRVYVTYDNKTYELDLVDKTNSEIERFTILHSVL